MFFIFILIEQSDSIKKENDLNISNTVVIRIKDAGNVTIQVINLMTNSNIKDIWQEMYNS